MYRGTNWVSHVTVVVISSTTYNLLICAAAAVLYDSPKARQCSNQHTGLTPALLLAAATAIVAVTCQQHTHPEHVITVVTTLHHVYQLFNHS